MTPEQEKEKILNDIKAAIHKEAAPCAANNPNQSQTPIAAPSQDPSPVTARGASIETTAPGGQTGTPDGSKLYFKKSASLVYRFSETGKFQFWLFSGKREWKPSDFLNQTYARENRESLKPPSQWLADYAAAQGWPEITQKEFDAMCKNMSVPSMAAAATTESPAAASSEISITSESETSAKTSQDMKSGSFGVESSLDQRSPADTVPSTIILSDAGTACLAAEPEQPAFDFSALGELAEQASEADAQFNLHYGRALDEYIISCIYLARIHDLTARVGRYGGGTWTAWYKSKGISEGNARMMVQNGDAFKSATIADLKMLPDLTRKDLNLIARSGCAQQVIDAAGNNQQVQELLAQLKAKDDEVSATKSQLGAALADVDGLSQQNSQLQKERDEAKEEAALERKEQENANASALRYKNEADRRAVDQQRLEGYVKTLTNERDDAQARIRELESRPVEVVGATPEDIARWRAEGAEQARKETQKELRRANAETAKERKRADEAERDRDEYADTMEKYATQLGELRGRQEMTDEQLHAIYTAEKAAETCTMVICQALGEICNLPRDLKAQAMNHLQNLHICLGKAISLGYWPTDEDLQDELDEPDEWPEEDEDV